MPIIDRYRHPATEELGSIKGIGPARAQMVIEPNDDEDLSHVTVALRANSAGDVALILVDDPDEAEPVVYTLAAGEVLDVRARRVMETGTDVTEGDLVAWY